MGKKKKIKMLKFLASKLPQIDQCSTEEHLLTGAEILSWGTVKEIDGLPIDPEKKYLYNYPVLLRQNNMRSMKKAFFKNGADGVAHLFAQTTRLMQNQQ